MAFTYDDSLALPRDVIRFKIGDTVADKGPRPDRRNFSDAEIAAMLSDEDDRLNGAIAALFETLAGEWAAWNLAETEGAASMDTRGMASKYTTLAEQYRAKPGGTAATQNTGRGTAAMQRKDAYA